MLGDVAARRTGLKLGDTFSPVAQAVESGEKHHHHDFKVVGILAHTGTPNDRAIFMNIEGFWREPAHLKGPSSEAKFLSGKNAAPAEQTAQPQDKADEPDARSRARGRSAGK